MKKILAILLLCIPMIADAHGSSHPQEPPAPQRNGIITPDVATSFAKMATFTTSSSGDTVVCQYYEWISRDGGVCQDKAGNNMWKRIQTAIPPGKTYVGFTIDSHSYVWVYWK